jgi:cyclohexadienyl dehydratase
MMRPLHTVAVALALLGALAASLTLLRPAQAQETPTRLDAILARGAIRVGTTGDYKPFTALDKATGEYSGFDIELARDLGEKLGVKVEFVPTTWSTLMRDLAADQFDIAMGGISVTLERQKKALFSTPYLRNGKTPIARCENKDRFATLEAIDRPGIKVVVNPGGTNERFVRGHLKSAEIAVFPDNTRIFEEIVDGRADLMITDASETRYQQKLKPQLCAIHPDQPFDFSEMAYLLPRDSALKAYVDQWLHLAIETGVYRAVFDKWLN